MSAQVLGGKQPSLKQLLGSGIKAANWEEAISHGGRTELPWAQAFVLMGRVDRGSGARA